MKIALIENIKKDLRNLKLALAAMLIIQAIILVVVVILLILLIMQ